MQAKRQEQIIKLLEEHGSVEVTELSALFNVTEKTIRQDLIKLERLQVAKRVHGGAMIAREGNEIFPVTERKHKHVNEKYNIASAALSLIEDGDTIILDSGTTTLELAKMIDKEIIAITNDPYIAYTLLDNEKVTLYVTGGLLNRDRGYTYVGKDAIRTIKNYRAKKCFLGVSALDFTQGLMVFSVYEQEMKQNIMQVSQQSILLADYSKFHKIALVSYGMLEDLHCLITDESITPKDRDYIKSKGITLEIASHAD